MRESIRMRVLAAAEYVLKTGATVRACAEQIGVGKTTIHKDLTRRLAEINPAMAAAAREILETNKAERHIRGGHATREKYLRRAQKEKEESR